MKMNTIATALLATSAALTGCGGGDGGDDHQVNAATPVAPVNAAVVPPTPTAQNFAVTVGKGVSDTMSGIVSRANVANLSVSSISVSRSGTYADCVWDSTKNILTITPRPSTEAPTDSCTLSLSDASGSAVSVVANLKDLDTKAPVLPAITPLSTTAGVSWTQVLPTATDAGAITYSVQRADGSVVPLTGAPYTFDPATRTLSGDTAIIATEILRYIATDAAGNPATQNLTNTVDHLGTASISGPATSISGPITLTLSANDTDGIGSWEVTSMNIGANGVR